eukprot:13055658-Alexandrium_andersonii.AAC.1
MWHSQHQKRQGLTWASREGSYGREAADTELEGRPRATALATARLCKSGAGPLKDTPAKHPNSGLGMNS